LTPRRAKLDREPTDTRPVRGNCVETSSNSAHVHRENLLMICLNPHDDGVGIDKNRRN
jgi:hypothetical protein